MTDSITPMISPSDDPRDPHMVDYVDAVVATAYVALDIDLLYLALYDHFRRVLTRDSMMDPGGEVSRALSEYDTRMLSALRGLPSVLASCTTRAAATFQLPAGAGAAAQFDIHKDIEERLRRRIGQGVAERLPMKTALFRGRVGSIVTYEEVPGA